MPDIQQRRLVSERNWVWLLALGIVFVVLGTFGLGMTVYFMLISILFFGVLLMIAGIMQLIDGIKSAAWSGLFWHMFVGVLYVVAAITVLYDPFLASSLLTMLIGILLCMMGLARFVMALTIKPAGGMIWLLISGLCALILGTFILIHWPLSGLWVIGLFFTIELLISGWSYIFWALAYRQSCKKAL